MHFTSTANTNRSINLKDKLTFTNSTSLSVNNIFFELLFNRSRASQYYRYYMHAFCIRTGYRNQSDDLRFKSINWFLRPLIAARTHKF